MVVLIVVDVANVNEKAVVEVVDVYVLILTLVLVST